MKKIAIIAATFVSFATAANAQVNSTAQQQVNLNLSNAIEITFTGSGTATGSPVTMAFTTVADYASGVESAAQQLKVRSNKNFTVAVKANSANFSYTGSTTPAPTMPVASVLGIMVPTNGTGGSIATPFSASAYSAITATNQNLITAGTNGGNKTFEVKYKADPQFNYPAGTYTVDVVYTATQD
jgi:hypothetical protein